MTHLGLTPPLQISSSPTTEKKIEKMPFISPFKIKNEIGCDFFFDLLPLKTEFQSISWASVLHSDYSSPNRGVGKSQLFRGLSVQASLQAVQMDSEHGLVFSLCAFNLPSRGTELNNHDPLVPLLHPARTGHFSCRLYFTARLPLRAYKGRIIPPHLLACIRLSSSVHGRKGLAAFSQTQQATNNWNTESDSRRISSTPAVVSTFLFGWTQCLMSQPVTRSQSGNSASSSVLSRWEF